MKVDKPPTMKKLTPLNIPCGENKRGKIDPADCTVGLEKCCHYFMSIKFDSFMCTKELIKAGFVLNKMGKYYQYEYPTLLIRWNRYLNFSNCPKTDTSKGFRQWRANTVQHHIKSIIHLENTIC